MEEFEAENSGGLGRRDFIKKSAIVGGMVWAAPAVSSFAPRAFGQENESPEIVFDCFPENRVKFKWERGDGVDFDKGQFVDCGSGGDCIAEFYSTVPGCVNSPSPLGKTTVTTVPGSDKKIQAVLSDDLKSVTISVIKGDGKFCIIESASVKGGAEGTPSGGYCEAGVISADNKSVTVSAPTGTSPDVSNVTGVICCTDLMA